MKKNIKLSIVDKEAKNIGEENFSLTFEKESFSPSTVAQAVKIYQGNLRKARAKTKTRSLVIGTKTKIWKQKGTGRARHGDRQAPIFVGGGVSHGPTGTQNYRGKLGKKLADRSLLMILAEKMADKKMVIVKDFNVEKTKDASLFIEALKGNNKIKGNIAFIMKSSNDPKKSVRNLSGVTLINAEATNLVNLIKSEFIVMTEASKKYLEERLN